MGEREGGKGGRKKSYSTSSNQKASLIEQFFIIHLQD